jgi:hypothetical protein
LLSAAVAGALETGSFLSSMAFFSGSLPKAGVVGFPKFKVGADVVAAGAFVSVFFSSSPFPDVVEVASAVVALGANRFDVAGAVEAPRPAKRVGVFGGSPSGLLAEIPVRFSAGALASFLSDSVAVAEGDGFDYYPKNKLDETFCSSTCGFTLESGC